jgi:hypothetical protein
MRKTMLALMGAGGLALAAAMALPALAESDGGLGAVDDSCEATPVDPSQFDVESVPAQPNDGSNALTAAAGPCDDMGSLYAEEDGEDGAEGHEGIGDD